MNGSVTKHIKDYIIRKKYIIISITCAFLMFLMIFPYAKSASYSVFVSDDFARAIYLKGSEASFHNHIRLAIDLLKANYFHKGGYYTNILSIAVLSPINILNMRGLGFVMAINVWAYYLSIVFQLDNIPMSIAALKLSNKIGCGRFIATGTVAEYAFCNDIMDVNARQTPNDIYGATKVAVHYYLEVLSRHLNQPFIWAVLPSTYGERRRDNNILTYTIKSLLAGEKPSYGNLEQLWDFLYVGDVVCALRLIGEKGQAGKVYGIGSGQFEALKKYIMQVRDIINPNGELGIGDIPTMNEKTFSSCVNIYDLVKDTGFAPRTRFDKGIVSTIEWMRKNKDSGV